jgi:hypothetical protein
VFKLIPSPSLQIRNRINHFARTAALLAFPFRRQSNQVSLIPEAHPRKRSNAFNLDSSTCTLQERLQQVGLWSMGKPLRLHLGCGQVGFDEYINIDYPPERHHVMHLTEADLFADISGLQVGSNEVDEVRLHHVFEHFSRVDSLLLLIKWGEWLKENGLLIIEVPDFEANAEHFLNSKEYSTKAGIVRHLVGDQSSPWGYHIEQWWPNRLAKTLTSLDFKIDAIERSQWQNPPFLCNCTIIARAQKTMDHTQKLAAADILLSDSLVNNLEEDAYRKWQSQLRDGGSDIFNYAS